MSFCKHRKYKDPEFAEQSAIEPDNTHAPEPIDMRKIYRLSLEYRQKRIEENPRSR